MILACVLIPSANARQSTGTESAAKPAASKTTHKHHTTGAKSSSSWHSSSKHSSKYSPRRKKSSRVRGQQKIDAERAEAIQEALIREHYLSGEPTGTWNQASEDAMRRYQADNGWQSKTVPDSRALIKLGLGPSKDHLLNPDSAMTTVPDPPKAQPLPTTSASPTPTSQPLTPAAPSPTPASSDSTSPQK
ncbi:MAG: peptidoglycan-binding protein [Candidatus Sulfotelmatobacter sp.]